VRAVHTGHAELPFDDDSFDVLVMVDVIHHLEHIEITLKESSGFCVPVLRSSYMNRTSLTLLYLLYILLTGMSGGY